MSFSASGPTRQEMLETQKDFLGRSLFLIDKVMHISSQPLLFTCKSLPLLPSLLGSTLFSSWLVAAFSPAQDSHQLIVDCHSSLLFQIVYTSLVGLAQDPSQLVAACHSDPLIQVIYTGLLGLAQNSASSSWTATLARSSLLSTLSQTPSNSLLPVTPSRSSRPLTPVCSGWLSTPAGSLQPTSSSRSSRQSTSAWSTRCRSSFASVWLHIFDSCFQIIQPGSVGPVHQKPAGWLIHPGVLDWLHLLVLPDQSV